MKVALFLLLAIATGAHAAPVTITLGNPSPGFSDGDIPPLIPDINNAQSGQPAPFDAGIGNDVLVGDGLSASWTFTYDSLVEPVRSATLTLGIVDRDSAATGSQVSLFSVEGINLTASLDTAFEARGGADGEYNVYTLTLPNSSFAALADGETLVQLALQGPGLVTPLFPLPGPNPPTDSVSNGAHLIYSTLEITPVPLPAAFPLLASGLAILLWRRRPAGTPSQRWRV